MTVNHITIPDLNYHHPVMGTGPHKVCFQEGNNAIKALSFSLWFVRGGGGITVLLLCQLFNITICQDMSTFQALKFLAPLQLPFLLNMPPNTSK